MRINRAIAALMDLRDKYGDVEIYADCPTCGASFKCGVPIAVSIHLTADAVDPPAGSTGKPTTREK